MYSSIECSKTIPLGVNRVNTIIEVIIEHKTTKSFDLKILNPPIN